MSSHIRHLEHSLLTDCGILQQLHCSVLCCAVLSHMGSYEICFKGRLISAFAQQILPHLMRMG